MFRRNTHGTTLLQSFASLVDDHKEQAELRLSDIQGRMAELEGELADLRQLKRKLEAAGQVA